MKASDWISVKDRLPGTGERVLVIRQIENEVFPDIATYIRRDNYHNGGILYSTLMMVLTPKVSPIG